MKKNKWYAAYKGDTFLCHGSLEEIAEYLNVKVRTAYYYCTQAYKNKIKNIKYNERIIVYEVEE